MSEDKHCTDLGAVGSENTPAVSGPAGNNSQEGVEIFQQGELSSVVSGAGKDGGISASGNSSLERFRRGEIKLPETQMIAPQSREYAEIFISTLPDGDGEKLLEAVQARRERLPRFVHFLLALMTIGIVCLAFYLWPKVPASIGKGESIIGNWDIEGLSLTKHKKVYARAVECYERGEYNGACEIIQPCLSDIFQDAAAFRKDDALVAVYFESAVRMMESGSTEDDLLILTEKARKFDPDRLAWKSFHLIASFNPYKEDWEDYGKLVEIGKQSWPKQKKNEKIIEAFEAMQTEAQNIISRNANNPSQLSGKEGNKAMLRDVNLVNCKVLIALWLLKGQDGKPDDKDDPGVREREESYRLAKENYKDAKGNIDVKFGEIMLSIAKKIRSNMWAGSLNFYYFDGKERYKLGGDEASGNLEPVIKKLEIELQEVKK